MYYFKSKSVQKFMGISYSRHPSEIVINVPISRQKNTLVYKRTKLVISKGKLLGYLTCLKYLLKIFFKKI